MDTNKGFTDKKALKENIDKNINHLMSALQGAYQNRPNGNEDIEDKLLKLMLEAKRLKEEIDKAFK